MTWQDGMTSVDLTPGLEEVALLEAKRLLGEGRLEGCERAGRGPPPLELVGATEPA